jgi:predicted protein tyrosine phosphatase
MTISRIRYTSRKQAEQLRGSPFEAVVSITDPTTPEAVLDPLFRRVLRLSFFDAMPADPFIPPPSGMFDHAMAGQISTFIGELHAAPYETALLVHCEWGISRSAAVALFAEAMTGAPLEAREFTCDANQWVLEQLLQRHPGLEAMPPPPLPDQERRHTRREG